jgi:deazaflavin-dependent oxidoreductase (nitroreductase family)
MAFKQSRAVLSQPKETTMTTLADSASTPPTFADRYLEPGWFTRNVFNRLLRRLTRLGLSIRGSRELRVKGRTSGEWRSTPVNLLVIDGVQYLVAPRGVTQWVRNLRAASTGELRVGRRTDVFRAMELADNDKPEILREYLRRWKSEVGVFFNGVTPDATTGELAAIAPGYPVFVIDVLG